MQIGNSFPSMNFPPIYKQPLQPIEMIAPSMIRQQFPGLVVDISPQAWAAYEQNMAADSLKTISEAAKIECQTCNSRRYQDVSSDSSVSFQTPTHIDPAASAAMVAAHENEHVVNEQHKAQQEGREIVSQTVTQKTAICPECKSVYVSGGETRTVSRQKTDQGQQTDQNEA